MGRLILATVGTSLFDAVGPYPDLNEQRLANNARDECQRARERLQAAWQVLARPNSGDGMMADLDNAELGLLQAYRPRVQAGELNKISAEMASLGTLAPAKEDRVVLLATDTVEGAFAARCVALLASGRPRILRLAESLEPLPDADATRHLQARRRSIAAALGDPAFACQLDVMVIEHLTWNPEQPDDLGPAEEFRLQGCYNLAASVAALIEHRSRTDHPQVVCNITGGLKSSIPFVTWVCALAGGVDLAYLYEESPALLQTPIARLEIPGPIVDLLRADRWTWHEIGQKEAGAYFDRGSKPPRLSLFGRVVRAYLSVRRSLDQQQRDLRCGQAEASGEETPDELPE